MNDILELIKSRRSVRKYLDQPVPKEMIEQLLEAAIWAPTGANLQPWQFIVVTNKDLHEQIGKYARFYFIKSHHVSEVPAVIVICGDPNKSSFYLIDCALAGENLILQAQSLGLSTCWIGAFDEAPIKTILNIPQNLRIVGLITVGYSAETTSVPPKISLKDIVHWNTFGSMPSLITQITKSGPLSIWKKIIKVILHK